MSKRNALIIAMDTVAKGTKINSEILARFEKILTNPHSKQEGLDFNVTTIGNANINPDTINDIIIDFFQQESDVLFLYLRSNDTDSWVTFTDYAKIAYSVLFQSIARAKSTNTIVVLDTLHSDKGLKSSPNINSAGPEKTLLVSSDAGDKIKGFMPFTEHLLTALEGQAANIEGYITMASVYGYIDSVLDNDSQRPTYVAHVKGFLPICKVESRVNPDLADLKNIAVHFKDTDSVFQLAPSFEEKRNIGEKSLPSRTAGHVKIFKELQEFTKLGLVEPCREELAPNECHMYFAAMQSKHCRLTALGKAYHAKYTAMNLAD